MSAHDVATAHNPNPTEVAVNELSKKVTEFGQLWSLAEVDMINYPWNSWAMWFQVNAGPLAHAWAFLDDKNIEKDILTIK